MTSFTVVSDELRAHASHLDGLVDRLNTAVSAANTVSMDNSCYGILCQFLPPIINAVTQQHATDALKASVTGMTDVAANVRTAATNYDQQDQEAGAPFQASLNRMDPSTGGSTGPGYSSGGWMPSTSIGSGTGAQGYADSSYTDPSYGSANSDASYGGGPGIELPPNAPHPAEAGTE
jgi:hypothetical protein